MPTIFKSGPYRFFFYASDGFEPIHIHVHRNGKVAKFWISPISLASNFGYRPNELHLIQKIIKKRRKEIIEQWNEFFKTS